MEERFSVVWRPRLRPLEPAGVVARGAAAQALARRLLARDDAALARLRGVAGVAGVAGDGLLALLGAGDELPWTDGVSYLGRDPDAPLLLLPTTREPAVHPRLLEGALLERARAGGAPGPPLAVILGRSPSDPPLLVSLAEARPIDRASLESWLAAAVPAAPAAPAGSR